MEMRPRSNQLCFKELSFDVNLTKSYQEVSTTQIQSKFPKRNIKAPRKPTLFQVLDKATRKGLSKSCFEVAIQKKRL